MKTPCPAQWTLVGTLFFTTVIVLGGCVEKQKGMTRAERQSLQPYVKRSDTEPDRVQVVSFENRIFLRGYDAPRTVRAGEKFTVRWHWHCKRALDKGWKLFTHVEGKRPKDRLNADGGGAVRRLYPPGQWKAGEHVIDEQTLTLPMHWSSEHAIFYVGVWNGPYRLHVAKGPNDGDHRSPVVTLRVRGARAKNGKRLPEIPKDRITSSRRRGDVEVDGALVESDWRRAERSHAFVRTMNGQKGKPQARVKSLWDDQYWYLGFDVKDPFIKADQRRRDAHLWKQDCVEIMVDPDGDGKNYFEIQVSPHGIIFDTRYDSRRDPRPFGHTDWDADIKSATTITRDGYTVEAAVRWSSLVGEGSRGRAPKPNDSWKANFFVMDTVRQGGQRAVGWSPPLEGDFHVLDRFGTVVFE